MHLRLELIIDMSSPLLPYLVRLTWWPDITAERRSGVMFAERTHGDNLSSGTLHSTLVDSQRCSEECCGLLGCFVEAE